MCCSFVRQRRPKPGVPGDTVARCRRYRQSLISCRGLGRSALLWRRREVLGVRSPRPEARLRVLSGLNTARLRVLGGLHAAAPGRWGKAELHRGEEAPLVLVQVLEDALVADFGVSARGRSAKGKFLARHAPRRLRDFRARRSLLLVLGLGRLFRSGGRLRKSRLLGTARGTGGSQK